MLVATVVDPLTEPVPPGWDAFATTHRLSPGWHSGPLRVFDWCVSIRSSMVVVEEPGGAAPVGLFHARHFGPTGLARFVAPGRTPTVGIAECRTAPVPVEAGLTFAAGTGERDQREAVHAFERALRRRTGTGWVVYRTLLDRDLAVVPTGGRLRRRRPPRMVLANQWPDLASYLGSVPAKWRSQLKKIHDEVGADPTVQVALADTVDPAEACWLAEVIRQRYTPRTPPRPPLPAHAIAELARLPGFRFLTYRDERGRLLGYSAVYDNGADLHLIWWGSRGGTDGWRGNLYFDQYLRLIDLMISTGRQRLILGGGMERIKARYGAQPEPRWSVVGPAVAAGGRSSRRRGGQRAELPPAPAPAPRRVRSRLRRLLTRAGRSPARAGLAAQCRQCGEWTSVNVFRLGPRRARYWCERCGAVVAVRGRRALRALRPADELREAAPRPAPPPGPAAGPGPGLGGFMPPAMLRWLSTRFRAPAALDPTDKSIVYHRYREWDAYLRRLGPAGVAALAGPGEPPPDPGLPAFSRVVGALHDGCYHVDVVVQRLRADLPPEVPERALRERVEHARRWLAGAGRALCWVHRGRPDGTLPVPDRSQVAAALAALRAGRMPEPAAGRAARAALFGTDGGPALPTLLRTYPTEDVIAALTGYLTSGARPLRAEVLARLTAPGDGRR
jgi:hypothetical protein